MRSPRRADAPHAAARRAGPPPLPPSGSAPPTGRATASQQSQGTTCCADPRSPGPLELIVVLVVALLVFGPKRLPDLGSSLGRGMREFNEAGTGATGTNWPTPTCRTHGSRKAHDENPAPICPAGGLADLRISTSRSPRASTPWSRPYCWCRTRSDGTDVGPATAALMIVGLLRVRRKEAGDGRSGQDDDRGGRPGGAARGARRRDP